MENCVYTVVKGGKELENISYARLLEWADGCSQEGWMFDDPLKVVDLLYSLSSPRLVSMDGTIESLIETDSNGKRVTTDEFSKTDPLDGSRSVDMPLRKTLKPGSLQLLSFFEADWASIDGKPITLRLKNMPINDYINVSISVIQQKMRLQGYTENEINERINRFKAQVIPLSDSLPGGKFDIILRDMMTIQKAILSEKVWNEEASDFEEFAKLIDKGSTLASNEPVILALFDGIRNFYNNAKSWYGSATTTHVDLNFSVLTTVEGKDIDGHIDFLFVDNSGVPHAYIFKLSVEDPADWNYLRENRYRQELSFLKLMLANKGLLNLDKMTLDVVPIKLNYEVDSTKPFVLKGIDVYGSDKGIRHYTQNYNGQYALTSFDMISSYFVKSNVPIMPPRGADLDHANLVLKTIFPECNINDQGLQMSARMLIARAPAVGDPMSMPLKIVPVSDPNCAYEVSIKNKVYKIKEKSTPTANKEILNLVMNNISDLSDQLGGSIAKIVNEIKRSWIRTPEDDKPFHNRYNFLFNYRNLWSAFREYIPHLDKDGVLDKQWELDETLIQHNILIFRNKDGLLDVVSITPFNINADIKFRKGKYLLGSYLTSQQYVSLKANYGNIEAVRVMTLLNEIIGSKKGTKLGTMKILSSLGESNYLEFDIGEFNRRYYVEILLLMQPFLGDLKVENHFLDAEFVDPLRQIWRTYLDICSNPIHRFREKDLLALNIEKLISPQELDKFPNDLPTKLSRLMTLLRNILRMNPAFNKPAEVEAALAKRRGGLDYDLAVLYDMITKTYLTLTDDTAVRMTKFNEPGSWLLTSFTHSDENVRHVVDNMQTTLDLILSELQSVYDSRMRNKFMNYYRESGYTLAENMVVGDLRRVYSNMINWDSQLFEFKNPYDMTNNLNNEERKLLKSILYEFEWIRKYGHPEAPINDDAKMAAYIKMHPEYIWVPLERASKGTRRASLDALQNGLKNFFRRMRNAADAFLLNMLDVTDEEMALLGNLDEFEMLRLRNRFESSMPVDNSDLIRAMDSRKEMLNRYGKEYFEINLEKIALDYLTRHISTLQFNKFLVATKALLLLLHLTGNHNGNKESVEKASNYVKDYLKVNVFHISIMKDLGKKVTGYLNPLRRFATIMLIGGNLVGMFRDTLMGILHNMTRALIKYLTNISAKSVAAAYWYVTKHATSNAMAINMLSKLCIRYRLAGTDIGSVAGRMFTGRNGFLNLENYLFGTMRTPDFMNRMVLFVARCIEDGIIDPYNEENSAFYIDKDNNLKYDWKKDKRFEAYAAGRISDPNYNELKLKYLSLMRQYRIANPDVQINDGDPLPDPYSSTEIRNILALADNIYGAYDRSKRAMFENIALGWTFGLFFSWMGGAANNYFASPQRNAMGKIEWVQETDERGRPLYFTTDGRITLDSSSGLKVLRDVPAIVQGAASLLYDGYLLVRDGGFTAYKNYLGDTPRARELALKVTTDIMGSIVLASLFKFSLDDKYKNYRKNDMINSPFLLNAFIELMYNGGYRSLASFNGPLVFFEYFLGSRTLPFVSAPWNFIYNSYRFATGQRNIDQFFTSLMPLSRSLKYTISAEFKK